MKIHNTLRKKRILRKKRTLKQRKNAQFRHYTRQTTLSSKMKRGGARDSDYIAYRKDQLRRVKEMYIMWTAITYNRGLHQLKPKLEKLTHLLESHIAKLPPTSEKWNIWSDRGQHIDDAISEINYLNQCIGRKDIEPIPIINNEQVLESTNIICNEGGPDENESTSTGITTSSRGITTSSRGITTSSRGITKSSRGITKSRRKSASERMINSRGL